MKSKIVKDYDSTEDLEVEVITLGVVLESILSQTKINNEILMQSKITNKYLELIYGDIVIESDIEK